MNRFVAPTPPPVVGESSADTALRQQALLLELTPVVVRDVGDRITYWNRSAEVMYGFTPDQALGRVSQELLHTRFPEPLDQILSRLRSGRQWQGELLRVRSDGREISVASEWIAYIGPGGELESVIEVSTEITERKRAEAALARATARFDGIIASAMDAIISIDAAQRIVLFNPAAERMFGVSSEAAMGQSIERFLPERFRRSHARQIDEFGATGVSTRRMGALGSISGLRANGEEFPIEASISQVEVAGEKLFTVILRDITRRQRAEESLRQAQADLKAHAEDLEKIVAERTAQLRESVAELEAFSYSLSHDMRAPLRAIQTFTHIALEDYGRNLGADAVGLLRRVLASAERMDRLMQDVLAFSRVSRQEIQIAPVDMEKVLLDVVMERPELQAPRAEVRVESPLLPMLANTACLTQCLANLLGNAVKFVAPGIRPRVRVWSELGSDGRSVRLWVEDNGIGIEREAQCRIFEMFQRLNNQYEGSGIGLAIVRKAADRMGGVVGVASEPGKGSRFWLDLPRA